MATWNAHWIGTRVVVGTLREQRLNERTLLWANRCYVSWKTRWRRYAFPTAMMDIFSWWLLLVVSIAAMPCSAWQSLFMPLQSATIYWSWPMGWWHVVPIQPHVLFIPELCSCSTYRPQQCGYGLHHMLSSRWLSPVRNLLRSDTTVFLTTIKPDYFNWNCRKWHATNGRRLCAARDRLELYTLSW